MDHDDEGARRAPRWRRQVAVVGLRLFPLIFEAIGAAWAVYQWTGHA